MHETRPPQGKCVRTSTTVKAKLIHMSTETHRTLVCESRGVLITAVMLGRTFQQTPRGDKTDEAYAAVVATMWLSLAASL